jgi:hypothetical protein
MEYNSTVEGDELARDSFKRKEETKGLGYASTEMGDEVSYERLIAREDGCKKPWRIT